MIPSPAAHVSHSAALCARDAGVLRWEGHGNRLWRRLPRLLPGDGSGRLRGGWLYDRLGSYAWTYGSASAVGGLAALLALTLRPRAAAVGW